MNHNINETQWWWKWDLAPHCPLYELDIGPGSPLCTISPIRCSTPLQNICFLQRTSFVGHFLLQPQSPLSDLNVFCPPANWAACKDCMARARCTFLQHLGHWWALVGTAGTLVGAAQASSVLLGSPSKQQLSKSKISTNTNWFNIKPICQFFSQSKAQLQIHSWAPKIF